MRIEVLTFPGCPNAGPTRLLVERIAAEEGCDTAVDVVEITEEAAARARRFLGSPSVQIDGEDIAREQGTVVPVSMTCRIYQTATGPQGVPPEGLVRAALQRAVARRSSENAYHK